MRKTAETQCSDFVSFYSIQVEKEPLGMRDRSAPRRETAEPAEPPLQAAPPLLVPSFILHPGDRGWQRAWGVGVGGGRSPCEAHVERGGLGGCRSCCQSVP